MKIKRFCYLFNLVSILAIPALPLCASVDLDSTQDTITRDISMEMEVSMTSILDIDFSTNLPSHMPTNSDYFEIFTWDKEVIKRVIVVKIDPIDSQEANKFIDNLEFSDLKPEKGIIHINLNSGVRMIHAKKNQWTVEMADGQEFNMNAYNIKITLFIPENIELRLKSNLSTISIGNLGSKAFMDLRSVQLKANRINELNLKATNSTLQFNELKKLMIQAKHCELSCSSIHAASINSSSFSEYDIKQAGDLEIVDSKEDTFTISSAKDITCNKSIFTDYYITNLLNKLLISSENGNVFIEDLDPDFSEVWISNSFSIIKIGSSKVSDLLINTRTQLSKYYLSDEIQTLLQKEELDYTIGRYYKGSQNSRHVINIDCKQCEINLK